MMVGALVLVRGLSDQSSQGFDGLDTGAEHWPSSSHYGGRTISIPEPIRWAWARVSLMLPGLGGSECSEGPQLLHRIPQGLRWDRESPQWWSSAVNNRSVETFSQNIRRVALWLFHLQSLSYRGHFSPLHIHL